MVMFAKIEMPELKKYYACEVCGERVEVQNHRVAVLLDKKISISVCPKCEKKYDQFDLIEVL
jgi:rubrerythrin